MVKIEPFRSKNKHCKLSLSKNKIRLRTAIAYTEFAFLVLILSMITEDPFTGCEVELNWFEPRPVVSRSVTSGFQGRLNSIDARTDYMP